MKRWYTPEIDAASARACAEHLSVLPPIAEALVRRGMKAPADAARFLDPRLANLSDPFALPDMGKAVARVRRALSEGERIAIYGDYDVDGITSTALLCRVLTRLGADVTTYLPSRFEEGYGLTEDGFAQCVKKSGATLIVTVDCGTNSASIAERARASGVDIVVTDHHEPAGTLIDAEAVVNPKLGGGFRELAGVGVAFKLCHALVKQVRSAGGVAAPDMDLREYLDLVAVGTVADIVPLVDENRILVRHGLARLGDTRSPGLRALMTVAGIPADVRAYHVGFGIGPRLNASGRMGDATRALELLLTGESETALRIGRELDDLNKARQDEEKRVREEAETDMGARFEPERDWGLVVARDGWHVGVIGIVASRVAQRFRRPAIVISFDEQGIGHGSGRSLKECDLVRALDACSEDLLSFGGHAMAAGLTIERSRLDSFRERFNAVVGERLAGRDMRETQTIDAWVELDMVSREFYLEEQRLRPFGMGNKRPVWACRDVMPVAGAKVVGKGHLKFAVTMAGRRVNAIGFGMGDRKIPDGPFDIAFQLQRNEYMGRDSIELNVKDFRVGGGTGNDE